MNENSGFFFFCLNNIENETDSSPNIHIRFEEVYSINACDIQNAYTKRTQRTVHPWSIAVSIKHARNSIQAIHLATSIT